MLIRRVIMENFGPYMGRHSIDVAPRIKYGRRRPVVLFGGKNGAGKTTLLDAVRLALYGKGALGSRVSKKEYASFLKGRIHRAKKALIKPSHAAVGVEFDFVNRGEKQTFLVERAWEATNSNGATEALSLWQGGEPLEDVDSESWDELVQGIVPERLSQLFFFDGEKIKNIAEDSTAPESLGEAIESLLGLDLVDRLDADLGVYASRQAKAISHGEDRQALEDVDARIEKQKDELEALREKLAQLKTRALGVEADVRKCEERLRQEGHGYAKKRAGLKERERALSAQIEDFNRQLRQECEGLFPLALCPRLAEELKQQLTAEQELRRTRILQEEYGRLRKEIETAIRRARRKAKKAQKDGLGLASRVVGDAIEKRLGETASGTGWEVVHTLSEAESNQVKAWLQAAQEQSAARVKTLAKGLEDAEQALRKTRVQLAKVPDDEVLKPLLERLNELNQQLGNLAQEREQIEAAQSSVDNELESLQRERHRLVEKQRNREGVEGRLTLIDNLQAALVDYRKRVSEQKVRMLRRVVLECFRQLCRKGDLLREIDIDPKTYDVILYDENRQAIPQEELSFGEKQILAVSLLWGLARTAGRPLPVIIDTPLARLDGDHRRNFIERYFPQASHQVLVLSTDTEVDRKLFKNLSPHISHCYRLEFEESEKRTEPVEGYFWKGGNGG